MSDESRPGDRRKREETLIEDYLTEREELSSGPRFHVPPFKIKQIEGTRTTYFVPVGADPESELQRMRAGADAARQTAESPVEAPGAAPPAPQPREPPAPPRVQPKPAMARMMETRVPRAFAALQARALQRAAEETAPQEDAGDEAPEPGTEPEEAGQVIAPPSRPELSPEAGAPPAMAEPKAAPPPPPPKAPPPAPEPAAPQMPPAPAAPPAPRVIDVPAARVKAAAEAVSGGTEASGVTPGAAPPFEPARPVSFRRPFVKPDTFGARKTGLPPLPRRVSAKELIARLRVVKEGVETRDQIVQRLSAAQNRPEAAEEEAPAAEEEGPEGEEEAATEGTNAGPEPAGEADAGGPPSLSTAPAQPEPEAAQRSDGGKLCPSCGTPVSEKNRLLVCTDCGRQNCDTCGRYEKSHMKSDVFYEYQFDWPLCLTCYEKAYTIQRMLGRASVCYGNGNFSYAMWYANSALQQDQKSRYVPKINDLVEKIERANKAAGERDREWRFARKQFARQPAEDPRWRQ